jgi:AcrR family transcriptional regulator
MADAPSELRERIVQAAARLLSEGGREAVSTRAVSAAAGVQAPAIYRQFGDMRHLLHAAARQVLAEYVRQKARPAPAADPVEELRRGWDRHIAFGLANPAAYTLLYTDQIASEGPEARAGQAWLTALVTRVAEAGRLRMSVPLAVKIIHAAGCGVTLTLITMPPEARDPKVATAMRQVVFASILAGEKAFGAEGTGRISARAVSLRAVLSEADDVLSAGERQLMAEWLDRIVETADEGAMAHAPKRGRGR